MKTLLTLAGVVAVLVVTFGLIFFATRQSSDNYTATHGRETPTTTTTETTTTTTTTETATTTTTDAPTPTTTLTPGPSCGQLVTLYFDNWTPSYPWLLRWHAFTPPPTEITPLSFTLLPGETLCRKTVGLWTHSGSSTQFNVHLCGDSLGRWAGDEDKENCILRIRAAVADPAFIYPTTTTTGPPRSCPDGGIGDGNNCLIIVPLGGAGGSV